ncbi:MAG: D-alanyl-D-alanine carboxypeptidase, partial [Chthoniobacteraceae bacterium]
MLNSTILVLAAVLLFGGTAPGATKKGASSKASSGKSAKKPAPTPTPAPLAPGELPLAAKSAILLDAKTGDVLYEKAPDEMEYPASATKILTALLVIEQGDLDKTVTIQPEDTKVEPSALEFKPGEQYTRRHLLFALLLKSANDVALALARDNAGSVAAFCEKMNRRAEALGALSTHFTNPHGLHDPHHFTTARDLGLIARVAMQQPLFR